MKMRMNMLKMRHVVLLKISRLLELFNYIVDGFMFSVLNTLSNDILSNLVLKQEVGDDVGVYVLNLQIA